MRTVLFWVVVGAAHAEVGYQDLVSPSASNWLTYSGAYHSQRHTMLKQIHTGNVKSLVPKWIYHVPGAGRLETTPLVVDLTKLEFMDSSGIAMLLKIAARVDSVEIRNPSNAVRRIIECTGLTDVLHLDP